MVAEKASSGVSDEIGISCVIPLFNEEESLVELHRQLTDVLAARDEEYEIIFVDDGSTDKSAEVIEKLRAEDPHVGCVRFRRNFGKAAGLDAGFRRARGKIIFTLDADLQDDPKEIPNFLAKLDEGYDVVSGWKKKRHDPLGKTLPSKFFNFTVSQTSGLKLKDFNCGFKAYRREAVEGLDLYGELHRFIPVLVHWRGFKVAQLTVEHRARQFGHSKYGVERLVKGAFDLLTVLLLTRYRSRPLHLFGFAGLLLSLAGFSVLSYLTVLWILGEGIGTRPLLTLGVLLVVVGIQLISVGLLGEMINSTRSTEGNYVIREDDPPQVGRGDVEVGSKVPKSTSSQAA